MRKGEGEKGEKGNGEKGKGENGRRGKKRRGRKEKPRTLPRALIQGVLIPVVELPTDRVNATLAKIGLVNFESSPRLWGRVITYAVNLSSFQVKMEAAKRNIAVGEADMLVLSDLNRVLNGTKASSKVLARSVIPLFGIRWNRGVCRRAGFGRIVVPIAQLFTGALHIFGSERALRRRIMPHWPCPTELGTMGEYHWEI